MSRRNQELELNSLNSMVTYLGGLAVALICTLLVGFLPDGDIKSWLSYLCTQIGFVLAILVLFKFKPKELASHIPVKRKINALALLMTVPITVGVFMQNTILAVGFVKLMSKIGITTTVELPLPDDALNVIMGLLCVCIAPAIGEELMFRGVIFSAHRDKGDLLAIVISAAIFALGHFNFAQLVHQFILGMILAYIVTVSENIWYVVAVHLINNVAALFLTLIPGYNELAAFDAGSAVIMAIMFVAGVLILYPSLYGFVKFAGRDDIDAKRDGWFFPIFFKKRTDSEFDPWHRAPAVDGSKPKPDVWLIVLLCTLAIMSVITMLSSLDTGV